MKPDTVVLLPTNKCNLKCSHCDIWKQAPVQLSQTQISGTLIELRDWLGNFKLRISGGEPLLYPSIGNLLEMSKQVPVTLVTNGVLLNDETKHRIASNNVQVLVSLHAGTKATYLQLRGADKFDEVLSKLQKLEGRLCLAMLLTSQNAGEFDAVFQIARRLKAKVAVQALRSNFGSAYSKPDASLLWPRSAHLKTAFTSIRKNIQLVANNKSHLKHIKQYYTDPVQFSSGHKCLLYEHNLAIEPDGRVHACCEGSLGKLGTPLKQLWENPGRLQLKSCILSCRIASTQHARNIFERVWDAI